MEDYNSILVNKINEVELDYIALDTNVKLYEIANNLNTDDTNEQYRFEEFCRQEFENFEEYLNENYCSIHYIGRTSSFQIDCNTLLSGNGNLPYMLGKNNEDKIRYLIECFEYEYDWDMNNSDDEAIEEIETHEEMFYRDLEEFINSLNQIVEVYKYIEKFKNNQIEYWNEYINEIYEED